MAQPDFPPYKFLPPLLLLPGQCVILLTKKLKRLNMGFCSYLREPKFSPQNEISNRSTGWYHRCDAVRRHHESLSTRGQSLVPSAGVNPFIHPLADKHDLIAIGPGADWRLFAVKCCTCSLRFAQHSRNPFYQSFTTSLCSRYQAPTPQ